MYNTEEPQLDTIGDSKTRGRQLIESLGILWLGVTCGFWYEHSLSAPELYGFDIENREAVFFDDGMQKLNTPTWEQVGRVVAEILSLQFGSEHGVDKSVTLESYRNRMAFVSSFAASQQCYVGLATKSYRHHR